MKILEYKGYHGSVTPDMERGVLRGKLLFISDLVTYEAAVRVLSDKSLAVPVRCCFVILEVGLPSGFRSSTWTR